MVPHRLILIILLVSLPATLHARWIEDKIHYQTEAAGKVEFSHYSHLEAVGNNCPTCHNGVFHIVREKNRTATMSEMRKGKSCGFCHNDRRAFGVKENCATCHPTREIIYEEPDAGDVVFSHDLHTTMYGCKGCHPAIFLPSEQNEGATMEEMSKGKSCGACHDGDTAFTVEENCESCHRI